MGHQMQTAKIIWVTLDGAMHMAYMLFVHILGSSAKSVIGQVGLIRQITPNEEGFKLC